MNKIKEYLTNLKYAVGIIYTASKKYFILTMFLSLGYALIPYLPMFLWRELINSLTIAVKGDPVPFLKAAGMLALGYGASLLAEDLLRTCYSFVKFKYNDAIKYFMDNLMIEKASSVDLAFFDSSDLKDKLKNAWRLTWSMENMVAIILRMMEGCIRLVISFSLLLTLSPWLVLLIVLLCIPSIIWDKKVNEIDYRFRNEHDKTERKLDYYKNLFFEGAKQEVRLYNLTGYFTSLYSDLREGYDRAIHSKDKRVCLINSLSLVLLTLGEVAVYVLSVTRLIVGKIAVGDVTYYVQLLTQFRSDFTITFYRFNSFRRHHKEIQDVRSFMEMPPMIEKSGTKIPSSNPVIEFRNVSFRYPGGEKDVLKDCSFTLYAGETVGLVGLNGSGKSTIVKLLCRFYDPTEGKILIDGIDNKEYDIVKLREMFGVLFQNYVKYSFSLRENVALSDLPRIDETDAIRKACTESRADDFMKEWEKGIDETLTRRFDSNGKELSGGQWQRISLARAFFRDAPIILLDEPSAALDPIAEHKIFQDFAEISKGRTAMLISHRLSSITLCDKILVLEDGHIIEQGSHRELLEANNRYAYLFNLQASKYI